MLLLRLQVLNSPQLPVSNLSVISFLIPVYFHGMWKNVKNAPQNSTSLSTIVTFQFGLTSNDSRSVSASIADRCLFISLPDWILCEPVNLREIVLAIMEFTDSILDADRVIIVGGSEEFIKPLRFLGFFFF
jgi:hypothetical protein